MIRKISILDKTHEEWMELRKGTIGGSEAGSVVGLNPYQSPFALWAEKTNRTKPFEGNLATEVGTYLEEFCAKKFQDQTGLPVQRSNFIYFNDSYPNQHALPDRVVKFPGYKAGLEIKTTSGFTKMIRDEFPAQYYCQCVQYLSVMEYDTWFLAVLVGNREFRIFQMKRSESIPTPEWVESCIVIDEDEINALRDACDEFMARVREDNAPLADGMESTADALSEAFPVATETEEEVDLSDMDSVIDEYLMLKGELKQKEARKSELENILKAKLGEKEAGNCGEYAVTWANSSRTTFDSKKLKKDDPDLWKRYSKTSPTRTFGVKTRKETTENA